MRYILFMLFLLMLPASSFAARTSSLFSAGQSLLVASSSPGNVYAAGASVVVAAPVGGDLTAFGGSLIAASPITGDGSLMGGSVRSQARVGGDFRACGGSVSIEGPVAGDVTACGYQVQDSGHAGGSVFLIAANVTVDNGAVGPVTIYGNNISLAGTFEGDVSIVASGRVSLEASTTIRGSLTYEAPIEAIIPPSATIVGGVHYTSASYLPGVGTSRVLTLVSIGLFLLVRVLGALILAGLLAGLFPRLAESFVTRVVTLRPSRTLLTALLGFAVFVVVPILAALLALTFVGIGLALLLFVIYTLVLFLSVLYGGILVGSLVARYFWHRSAILWRDGVVGMLALSLLTLVPYGGLLAAFFCTVLSAGALVLMFFRFAFPHEEHAPELV